MVTAAQTLVLIDHDDRRTLPVPDELPRARRGLRGHRVVSTAPEALEQLRLILEREDEADEALRAICRRPRRALRLRLGRDPLRRARRARPRPRARRPAPRARAARLPVLFQGDAGRRARRRRLRRPGAARASRAPARALLPRRLGHRRRAVGRERLSGALARPPLRSALPDSSPVCMRHRSDELLLIAMPETTATPSAMPALEAPPDVQAPRGLVLPDGPGRRARRPAACRGDGLRRGLAAPARRAARIARNAALDLRYGRPLGGTVRTRYAHLGAFDTANSCHEDLPALFAAAGVTAGDVVVDIGCGKGRVLNWLLRNHPAPPSSGSSSTPSRRRTRRRLRRRRRPRHRGRRDRELPARQRLLPVQPVRRERRRPLRRAARRCPSRSRTVEPGGRLLPLQVLGPFERSDRFAIRPIELAPAATRPS